MTGGSRPDAIVEKSLDEMKDKVEAEEDSTMLAQRTRSKAQRDH